MLLDDAIRFDFRPRERFPPQQTAQSIPSALFAAAVAAVADSGDFVRGKLWNIMYRAAAKPYDQGPMTLLKISANFAPRFPEKNEGADIFARNAKSVIATTRTDLLKLP